MFGPARDRPQGSPATQLPARRSSQILFTLPNATPAAPMWGFHVGRTVPSEVPELLCGFSLTHRNGVDIHLGDGDALMAEPISDGIQRDATLTQEGGHRVAEQMWMDALQLQSLGAILHQAASARRMPSSRITPGKLINVVGRTRRATRRQCATSSCGAMPGLIG